MKKFKLKQQLLLYAVSDTKWLGNQSLAQQIEAALYGGITMLQLREKNLPQAAFLHEAIEIKQMTSNFSIPLIINDDLQVAYLSKADGLHIGQDDGSVLEARYTLGKDKILGVSAQTVEQAVKAEAEGADYLGVGAIFPTNTKTDSEHVDISQLQEICRAVNIPVVAIGGINSTNIYKLYNTNIAGVAFVSAIFSEPNITQACKNLKNQLYNLF